VDRDGGAEVRLKFKVELLGLTAFVLAAIAYGIFSYRAPHFTVGGGNNLSGTQAYSANAIFSPLTKCEKFAFVGCVVDCLDDLCEVVTQTSLNGGISATFYVPGRWGSAIPPRDGTEE
jgi:hypothetical protein